MVKLKGENQIEKFRKVAERLSSKISSYEGVAGVVFVGGLARGFADRFSDLDITVFLGKDDEPLRTRIRDIGLNEEKRSGIEVDLEVYSLRDFEKRRWDEMERWEFSKAKIVFDSEGEVKRVFEEKLRLPEDFWVRRIAMCAEYLKWYSCQTKENTGTISEAWIERGDSVSAHYCLNYAVELLIKTVFALNREFLPAPKWRLFYSYGLKWLPEGYRELVEEALIAKDFSVLDFKRRLNAIQRMWREIVPRTEDETGLNLDQIHEYYVEKILCQRVPQRY